MDPTLGTGKPLISQPFQTEVTLLGSRGLCASGKGGERRKASQQDGSVEVRVFAKQDAELNPQVHVMERKN